MRNVELKAHCPDPMGVLATCQELVHRGEASDGGILWQEDTYFHVSHGRLKLREQDPGGSTLVQYDRADEAHQRLSSYHLVPVESPEVLKRALGAALGVEERVVKHRHLFLWQNVRIHLDKVEDLGDFIELEAVAEENSDLSREHRQVTHLRQVLSIEDGQICSQGYAQLLRKRAR